MSDDDFLSRWSRRKRAVAEDEAKAPEPQKVAQPTADIETEPEEDETAVLARLDLPVPETLQPGDDFSAFMADGVPAFLRKRALRVLWRSNPVLANLDGLNDYDEDFTSPELTQKVLATAYQVGRGFVSRSEPDAEQSADESPVEETVEDIADEDESTVIIAEKREAVPAPDREDELPPQSRPRRMRFET